MDYLLKQQNQQRERIKNIRTHKENNEEKQYSTARQKSTNQQCVDTGIARFLYRTVSELSSCIRSKYQLSKVNLNRNWTSTAHNSLKLKENETFNVKLERIARFGQLVSLFIIDVEPEKQRTNGNNRK